MSNPTNAAPVDTGTAAPTAGQPAAPPPATNAPATAGQPPAAEPWRNPAELRAGLKQARELAAMFEKALGDGGGEKLPTTPSAASTPPPASMDPAAHAVLEVSISQAAGLTEGQAGALRSLFSAEKPPVASMAGWLKDKLALFGRTAQGPATTASPATAATTERTEVRTNLGAPGGSPAGGPLPDDIRAIPIEVWKNLDPAVRHKLTKAFVAKGTGQNSGLLRRTR